MKRTPSSPNISEPGRLILVVGPSGVGKDTLLDGARGRLAGDDRVVFARREITRPADAGGEAHAPVSLEDFRRRADAGGYLLHWEAHGLGYGVPADLGAALADGRTVVVNASRTVLDAARRRHEDVRVISVEASPDVLAARLAARGRETAEEVTARLARAGLMQVEGPDVVVVRNDGALAAAVDAMVAAIAG